ncbi:hypothetical protein [Shewanella woodyi]|uniref:hypothetical protein n=1 Tax=Shewanella woodyi TaxID=60961 RepID=UPI003747DFDA
MYKPNELKQDITGIYKRFPKLPTYTKNLENWHVDYSEEKLRLDKCASGERFTFSHADEDKCKKLGLKYEPKPYTWLSMAGDLSSYSTKRFIDSYLMCFKGDATWQEVFREAATYDYWALRMELIEHKLVLEQFLKGKRKQKPVSHLRSSGVTLGICIALGWLEYARELRDRISFSLEHDMVNDGYDHFGRRRTQHFLIRLLNSHDEISDIQLEKEIKCAYDVPIFNEIIDNWKSGDTFQLTESIINLCDRHTHQCRQDSFNNNRYYDFSNLSLEYYLPVEILSIFKLREERGLNNLQIDHKIMNTPLAGLDGNFEPHNSDFLDSLLWFARAECGELYKSIPTQSKDT